MDLYALQCIILPNKGEKVKRPNRFETLGPETDKHEISQEKNAFGFNRPR
jgi:hypothetical protein